eukprot:TRINITY_DN1779_c1_g2_i1.p1 TRINITY_DN1779_c1_g2~~TRINITY_DN1779_c1_g2_i1.p1  ORF type:complete len:836 (+),score=127.19 TRINITY_DN1779_c1_g2_i1:65-2572(+)
MSWMHCLDTRLECALATPGRSVDDLAAIVAFAKLCIGGSIAGVIAGARAATYGYFSLTGVAAITGIVLCLSCLAVLFKTRSYKEVSYPFMIIAVVVTILYDMSLMPEGRRGWALFILVNTAGQLMRVPRSIRLVVVGMMGVWLVVAAAELTYRMGLLDIPTLVPYEERAQSCAKPPCPRQGLTGDIVYPLVVLLVEVGAVAGFTKSIRDERLKMCASVDAAQYIAQRLADFDLAAASAYLHSREATLPLELVTSFSALLANLESYRPYLPAELFAHEEDMPSDMPSGVPGLSDPWIALVFTDIRASSQLWEASPEAMRDAMLLHDDAIRTALHNHSGYEVKTIGDSFMVAFRTSVDAVRFGAAAQTALGSVAWPAGLTRPNAGDGFGVLSVRIGIHCGEVSAQQNQVTGRYDYFGPTVNRAARVEPFGAPGALTVTSELLHDIGDLPLEEAFVVVPYEKPRAAKGLRDPLELTALLPRSLAETEAAVREVIAQGEGVRKASRKVSLAVSNISSGSHHSSFSDGSRSSRGSIASVASEGRPSVATSSFQRMTRRAPKVRARATTSSLAVVKFDFLDELPLPDAEARASRRLQILHGAAQRTKGYVSSVWSTLSIVYWSCGQHLTESTRFVLVMLRDLSPDDANPLCNPFHAGIATGSLSTAEFAVGQGTQSRRYVTPFGPCVDLAVALCSGAAELGKCVLVAAADGAGANGHARTIGHVSLVEQWNLGPGRPTIDVYELFAAALAKGERSDPAPSPPSSPTAQSKDCVTSVDDPLSSSASRPKGLAHALLKHRAAVDNFDPTESVLDLDLSAASSLPQVHPLHPIQNRQRAGTALQ